MPYHYEKTGKYLQAVEKKIEEAIYTPVAQLKTKAWVTPEPVPFAERLSGQEIELQIGQSWGKLWDCAWFHFSGQVPAQLSGQKKVLLIDLSGEGCVVDQHGSPVLGLTTVASVYDYSLGLPGKRVVELPNNQKEIDLWVEAGNNDLFGAFQNNGTLVEASIALCQTEMRQLYYDFWVLHELGRQLPAESARSSRIVAALHAAANCLTEYTDEEAHQARACLAPELSKTGGTPSLSISAIGHAHIDLAWLWPLRETIRKGGRTFATAIANMERYPDYMFGASQPQLYQWVKDYYPALYQKVKAKIAEGRWETQGAMWVESDTNVAGGEALIRQILYGKRFFQTEFDKTPKMLWLPDVFGYSAALPQLLKKSGIDYFMTIKLSWSEFNNFPHHTFWWQGIDGSQVLTHMPPEGTYNSSAAPRAILATEKSYLDKYVSDQALLLFGIGDGGGGPGEEHLERLAREKNLSGLAPVTQEPAENFFKRLEKDSADYKSWVGELYLEKHQGTYTSQALIKRNNRKIEYALRELEMIAGLASQVAGHEYPTRQLETIWKEALLYQFHDILPGSSIKRVYDEASERYRQLLSQTAGLLNQASQSLISKINTAGFQNPRVVTNTLSWERAEWLQIEDNWQKVTVPALGYSVVEASGPVLPKLELTASDNTLENDKLKIAFAKDGSIQSIFDKENGREVIDGGASANLLAVYDDQGDAWDFAFNYADKAAYRFALESATGSVEGPQAVLTQRYIFGKSSLEQKIVLTAGSRRVDFVTRADWQETHKMLRVIFPVSVRANEATCNIQFGTVKRSTNRNTSWEMAKTEICAHKWVDLSQRDYGVALLNDCKYGYSVAENELNLNLLRSSTNPGVDADKGDHEFTYALYPHAGDHIDGKVIQAGYELNLPLQTYSTQPHSGNLPARQSFAQVEGDNIFVEGLKKAEDGNSLILRLYEAAGGRVTTQLVQQLNARHADLTNLMEENISELELEDGKIELTFDPFEIHTVRFSF